LDRLEPVLGLATSARPDGLADTDHVLGDLDAEPLGGQEVTERVQRDRDAHTEGEEQDSEKVHHGTSVSLSARPRTPLARFWPPVSARSTVSTSRRVESFSGWMLHSSTTRSTVSTMSRKRMLPARNACTH